MNRLTIQQVNLIFTVLKHEAGSVPSEIAASALIHTPVATAVSAGFANTLRKLAFALSTVRCRLDKSRSYLTNIKLPHA